MQSLYPDSSITLARKKIFGFVEGRTLPITGIKISSQNSREKEDNGHILQIETQLMTDIDIRPASLKEFETAIGWAAVEGWNPGLGDMKAFHKTDPNGFLIGWKGGIPICSISVVRYGRTYGFLGFYIVHSDFRGTGAGIAIWRAGMDYLAGRTVGLDGVLDQQENYERSGFVFAGRNVRYSGVPVLRGLQISSIQIREASASDYEDICNYDLPFFPAHRTGFLAAWILDEPSANRRTVIALKDEVIIGYATIRKCLAGYKIGPLFADNHDVAERLFETMCRPLAERTIITIDIPADNLEANRLVNDFGLKSAFETARMYRGGVITLPIEKTFGITTLELG